MRVDHAGRAADLDQAIALAPESPGVCVIVADAYTYGNVPDRSVRSQKHPFELAGGLNTPRVHAIFASAYLAFGNQLADRSFGKGKIRMATARRLSSVSDLKARDEITSANACRRES